MDSAVDAFKPATAITLIPHAILWLQATLLFARVPAARTLGLSSDTLAQVRLALLPIAVCAIWTCYTNKNAIFYPQREWIHLNMTLCVGRAWSILKSIEYATADPEAYKWMGYKWAYSPDRGVTGSRDRSEKIVRDADEAGEKAARKADDAAAPVAQRPTSTSEARTWKSAAWLGWRNLWNLRGIGWSYGLRGEMIPPRYPPHRSLVLCLLGRILWSHALGISCLIYILRARELSSDPSFILHHFIGLEENSAMLSIIGKLLQSAAFGIAIYASIETDSAYFTLLIYSLTHLLRIIIPCSLTSLRPNAFNLDAWPKLSRRPLLSESIADFWGYRWHGLFRIPFLAVGYKPAMELLRRTTGCRDKTLLLAIGLLAAFMLSGFIHEGFNDATPWLARDPYYRSMAFFALQPLGIVLENTFTRFSGRRVGGRWGRLWAWAFLLSTGTLISGCWISRGFVDNEPPLKQWEWWRWCVPNAAVVPSIDRIRIYQVRLLDDARKGV